LIEPGAITLRNRVESSGRQASTSIPQSSTIFPLTRPFLVAYRAIKLAKTGGSCSTQDWWTTVSKSFRSTSLDKLLLPRITNGMMPTLILRMTFWSSRLASAVSVDGLRHGIVGAAWRMAVISGVKAKF
jgi:hypothetical protein